MIKYKLICKNCDLLFDSWFSSSKEYEKLKKKNFLNCHNCNSKKVEKTLMAPQLMSKSISEKSENKRNLNLMVLGLFWEPFCITQFGYLFGRREKGPTPR